MNTAAVLPIGTLLIHYNHWTGFETKEFKGQFNPMTSEDIRNLKAGDIVFINLDPLHPNGKVYGRVKAFIEKMEPCADGEFRFYFESPRARGFGTTKNGVSSKIDKAVNEAVLVEIVKRLPLSTKL